MSNTVPFHLYLSIPDTQSRVSRHLALFILTLPPSPTLFMPPDGDYPGELPRASRLTMTEPQASWKTIASRKLADSHATLAAFPEWHLKQTVSDAVLDVTGITWSELTSREQEIVNHDATALAQAIRERQYTAVEVIKAFCHVATIAHQLTNCLTEIFFAEGLQRAA